MKMFGKIVKRITAPLMAVCVVFSCLGGVSLDAEAKGITYADTDEYESLAEIYKDYFKMGAACEAIDHWNQANKEIGNAHKEKAISTLFNSITCGNEMKPAYNFSSFSEGLFKIDKAADEMMNWATENGVAMRGHTLVWHGQVNPSIFAIDFKATSKGISTTSDSAVLDPECLVDRETLIDRLRTYIYSMMEYTYANGYAATIYAWDVVNEAMDEGQPDQLRASYWKKIIGPEFLYYSFLFAKEAEVKFSKEYASLYGLDPEKDDLSSIQPKLFLNDYNEWFSGRVSALVKYSTEYVFNAGQSMVKSDVIKKDGDGTLKGDGLLDGIGMQGHLSDDQNIETYMKALRRYSEAVGEVHITELDVGCTGSGDGKWYRQAQFYYDFFSALVKEVENGVNLTSVTIWGLTDDSSWRNTTYPLLFNSDLSAKPAYLAVAMAGKKEEFNISLADAIGELTDSFYDFESTVEDGTTKMFAPEDNGFMPRGAGHQPKLVAAFKMNHTPDVTGLGFGLRCYREAVDANLRFNISKYCGQNITVTFYAKSKDSIMYTGLDGDTPVLLQEKEVNMDDWTEFKYNFDVPKEKTAFIYVETNGMEDFFIDDFSVVFTKEGEEPPVIEEQSASPVQDVESPETEVLEETVTNEEVISQENNPVAVAVSIAAVAILVAFAIIDYRRKIK